MTMPKKSSRAVEIDGKPYRYIVRAWDDHGLVQVMIEASEYAGHMLTAIVYPGVCAKRGIGGPQITAIVRVALTAGWDPKTTRGSFQLDDNLAGWAIEDDARGKVAVRDMSHMVAEYIDSRQLTYVNSILAMLRIKEDHLAEVVKIINITKPHAAMLSARPAFCALAKQVFEARIGVERAAKMRAFRA